VQAGAVSLLVFSVIVARWVLGYSTSARVHRARRLRVETHLRDQPIALLLHSPKALYNPRLDCFLSWRENKHGSNWYTVDIHSALNAVIKIFGEKGNNALSREIYLGYLIKKEVKLALALLTMLLTSTRKPISRKTLIPTAQPRKSGRKSSKRSRCWG
jgi:hypothetical protein